MSLPGRDEIRNSNLIICPNVVLINKKASNLFRSKAFQRSRADYLRWSRMGWRFNDESRALRFPVFSFIPPERSTKCEFEIKQCVLIWTRRIFRRHKRKNRPALAGRLSSLRSRADSNRCTSFCRALPSRSATRPFWCAKLINAWIISMHLQKTYPQ